MGELFNGHLDRFHSAFRMSKRIFIDLLGKLEHDHELHGSQRTTTREVLAITFHILAHAGSMRLTREHFQHSIETISREIPAEIQRDQRYMPFFMNCIGAIDRTHVDARIPLDDQVKYIGRHGTTTQMLWRHVTSICASHLH